jgi:hypothetical protein
MTLSRVAFLLSIIAVICLHLGADAAIACERVLASPTRAWINSTTGQLMVSTPTLVDNKVVYPGESALQIRGIGYAPAPIGTTYKLPPYGDWYTEEYKHLWSVDIPRMADIGINLVRIWNWKLFDAPSHLAFLDTLYENKMYALLPFEMLVPDGLGDVTFRELALADTRKSAVRQFMVFVKEVASHPAVLGFLIGNELDAADKYGNQLELYFSLINDMIAELRIYEQTLEAFAPCREKFNCRHMVSAPFRADHFKDLYTNFFWSQMDFWSFQPYDADKVVTDALTAYATFAVTALSTSMSKTLKPALITERGTASVFAKGTGASFNVSENEDWQATFLNGTIKELTKYMDPATTRGGKKWAPLMGLVIMEWSDEWWKGQGKNTLPIEGCPEDNPGNQSNCGFLPTTITTGIITKDTKQLIVAEEKLGICAQVPFERDLLSQIFLGYEPAKLKCKNAFTAVCNMWGNPKTSRCLVKELDRSNSSGGMMSIVILNGAPFLCLIVTLIWGAILLCLKKKHDEEDETLGDGSGSSQGASESQASGMTGSIVVDTINSAKRFNAFLVDEADLGLTDPRLDWIIDDLLRRGEVRADRAKNFRCLWARVVGKMTPVRQTKWSTDGAKVRAEKFTEADLSLQGFVEAVDMLHRETMAYVGIRNWRDRYSKISHMARSDEPDVQLQEIVLYYSVRLEHHAIGHAVEFVTENFLTMREALLAQQSPVTDADRAAAWTALADRVDAAYNVMHNGQLHERVVVENGISVSDDGSHVCLTTTKRDDKTHSALKFSSAEHRRFRFIAGSLERIRGDEHLNFLRPVAIDETQRVIVLAEEPEEKLGQDLAGTVKKLGIELALHVCYSLETLHSVKVAHGSIDVAHIGRFEMKDKRKAWVLLPAATMDMLTHDRVTADLAAIGQLLQEMAEVTEDEVLKTRLTNIGKSCQQSPPLSLELCIEQLEQNKPHCLETPEKPPSYEDLNQTALDQRSKHGGTTVTAKLVEFRRSFQESGGLLAAFCNYSFFMRYMLWQWVYSYTSQPVLYNRPICVARTAEILAVADAALSFITYFAEVRLLKNGTHRVKLITATISMFVFLGAAGGLYLVGPAVEMIMMLGPVQLVLTPHTMYLLAMVFIFMIKDVGRFCASSGRGEHGFAVRKAEPLSVCGALLRGFLYTVNWLLILGPILYLTDFGNRDVVPTVNMLAYLQPSLIALIVVVAYNLILSLIARVCTSCYGGVVYNLAVNEQLGAPAIFWMFNYVIFNALMSLLMVPGVAFVDSSLCANVSTQRWLGCTLAWVFNWSAFVIVSFALFGILYIGWSLLASILVAFARSIGELHCLADVFNNLKGHRARRRMVRTLMRNVRGEPEQKLAGAIALFDAVLQSLIEDHKMTLEEKEKLVNWFIYADKKDTKDKNDEAEEDPLLRDLTLRKRTADRDFRLENEEAEMVVVMFLASLENMPVKRGFDVQSMPSFTMIIPYFSELVYHDFQSMRAQPTEQASGIPSDLRMAAAAWPDEWRRLTEELQTRNLLPKNATPDELLETYHRYCWLKYPTERAGQLVQAVEQWATYRNQTLARIVRGISQLRKGLAMVAKLELASSQPFGNDEEFMNATEKLVTQKFQVICGAQIMSKIACKENPSKMTTRLSRCQLTNLIELQAANPFLEFVFDAELEDGMTPVQKFEEMLEHARAETDGIHSNIVYDRVTSLCGSKQTFCGTRYYSCHVTLTSQSTKLRKYELNAVERPGALLLGPKYTQMAPRGLNTQGKAENQFHAAQFARGSNFFTLDMNQDMCISEGFKLPTMVHHFLGGNKRHRYGIVGFTERCYTRSTSLAGELAGASEFAFVTIVQRVLRSALRIRMHYGHPDLMSGLLARTIGFNKASHGVNVNEDIFAGYECLARGVPIGFCEWIWFWKGRDTSLRLVAIFNNKLAEGAAQQVRSRDMHFLNANLNWLSRSSLLLGTVGFYWMSVLLHASIRLYIWSLLLFEVSGVSNFDLGVANGIISVAWAFQLGYVMALPGLIENTVQYGLMSGVMRFIRYVIPSVFFHAFMLQVTSEGFLTGLFTSSSAYAATGRGYDLTPVDVTRNFVVWGYSHYWKAVEMVTLLVWYAVITGENSLSYFIRTITIWVLIASLFGAPFFFQCPPNSHELSKAGSRLWTWALRKHEMFGSYKNLVLPEKIEDTERRSYRTWFARRFASPLYAASFRSHNALNFIELMLTVLYREIPILALMLVYFDLPMVPLMLTTAFVVIQAVALRRMFSGRYQRHFSRIMMITSIIVILCLVAFYLAARVLLFSPFLTVILVVYLCRFAAVLWFTMGTWRGTSESFIEAGMKLAWVDYPAAIMAAAFTYGLAWIASKVLRGATISWNYTARYAQECRRSDDKKFNSTINMSDDDDDQDEDPHPKDSKSNYLKPQPKQGRKRSGDRSATLRAARRELDAVETRRRHQEAEAREDAVDQVAEANWRTREEADREYGPFGDVGGTNEPSSQNTPGRDRG